MTGRFLGRSPWSFKLDYDKEIAADQAHIEHYGSAIMRAISASLTAEEASWMKQSGDSIGGHHVMWWIFHKPELVTERAGILHLSDADLCDLGRRYVVDRYVSQDPEAFIRDYSERAAPGTWKRSDDLLSRLEKFEILRDEVRLRLWKKARTDLARHTRNKAKFGG